MRNAWQKICRNERLSNIFFFADISECDGCDCRGECCFKKLMEFISTHRDYKDVVDWGSVFDEWKSNQGTVEDLGALIRNLIEKNRFVRP